MRHYDACCRFCDCSMESAMIRDHEKNCIARPDNKDLQK